MDPEVTDESNLNTPAEGAFEITPEMHENLRAIERVMAIPLESLATVCRCGTACDLLNVLHSYPLNEQQWAFRGHTDSNWKLEPTIERLRNLYKDSFRNDAEKYVRTAFRRRAHHYLQFLPARHDELEWLALMRHHGAPTRLLDWTRSPYIAAFFALAEAKEDQESAIWAIDTQALKMEAVRLLVISGAIEDPKRIDFSFSNPAAFDRVFLQETKPAIVAPVQPLVMNERVVSQQGLFLCSNNLTWGFEFALKHVLESDRDHSAALYRQHIPDSTVPFVAERLFKIYISPQARSEVLRELHRMNINYATLFPGLDGFGRSLGTNVTVSGFNIFGGDDFDSLV